MGRAKLSSSDLDFFSFPTLHDRWQVTFRMDCLRSSGARSPFYHPGGHIGQPPVYFPVCGSDMVRDESLIYERALREEYGVKTKLDIYPGLPHIFWNYKRNEEALPRHDRRI